MYEKTNWNIGDKITAEKLNNIEDGIAMSVLRIDVTIEEDDGNTSYTLSKTYAEIKACIDNGGFAITVSDMTYNENTSATYIEPVTFIVALEVAESIEYRVAAGYGENVIQYSCHDVDDYPSWNGGK